MTSDRGHQPGTGWMQRFLVIAAWSVLAALAFVTLAPISFRPHLASAKLERFLAFALVAALFGLAYPKALLRMMLMLIAAVAVLELGQLLTASRHAGVIDVAAKLTGIGVGALFAALMNGFCTWRRRTDPAAD